MTRTVTAAALLIGLLALLLGAWFVAGWSDVRARQAEERARPLALVEQRSAELARDLRAELDAVLASEQARDSFQYQNLYRDPRASRSVGVAPSPLAGGPPNPLVLGHFQIDASGKVTTPTINDDVPALSEQTRLAEHTAFREQVSASLARLYTPPARAVQVAQAEPEPPRPRPRPPRVQPVDAGVPDVEPQQPLPQQAPPQQQIVQQQVDLNNYSQNLNSNSIYLENTPQQQAPRKGRKATAAAPPPEVKVPALAITAEIVADPPIVASTPPKKPVPRRPVTAKIATIDSGVVTITVSPLALATVTFGAAKALVATRTVDTPDGVLAQGLVIDHAQIQRWLDARGAGATIAHRVTADSDAPPAVASALFAPDWFVDVHAPAAALASSAMRAGELARTFVVRFVALGALALLAAVLVVVMVSRAERLARERSQFAAAAAHELRTPLAGLQLYGDMLADGMGDPSKQRDYAKRMAEEAARLGRVVSNVLGFSQLERGNLSVDARPGDLAAELSELAARDEPALDRAGAALALEVTPELRARFDRDALARIVGNLLDNAEKYSRDAEDRTITLTARSVDGAVEVSVLDHGPGVATAARASLFSPFKRGVSADGPAGLGLGLALSQSLARAMGGDVLYRPPASGGAGFVLRLVAA